MNKKEADDSKDNNTLNEPKGLTTRQAELLLALSVVVRGSALMFCKLALEEMGPFTLIAYRTTIAFIVLAVIFHKRLAKASKQDWIFSALIALGYFASMALEQFGLRTTSSSTTGFIENLVVVFIPMTDAALRRVRPNRRIVESAFLALAGATLLTLFSEGRIFAEGFTVGELYIFASTFAYTAAIIMIDRFAKAADAFNIGIIHLLFIAIYSGSFAFIFENPALPGSPAVWGEILYLAIVSTAIGFAIQPVAQKYTSAERTGILNALNPVTAMILGIAFLGESFNTAGIIGAALILFSIFWSSKTDK